MHTVQIYRWILYHIILYTSRFKNQWPHQWHPSNMVFSCCKAEVEWNRKFNPEYNPFGKYWLKLFFMGKFRMVCVSDHLPVSDDNSVLLPLCENNKVLWLPLLVKGLLRIYALAEKFEQFNTITCFTGWTCIRKNCRRVSKEDLWLSVLSHTPSNPLLDSKRSESQSKKKKIIVREECFPIKTTEGNQCFRNQIISDFNANPPNSIITAITLSPAVCKDKTTDSLNRYSQPVFLNGIKTSKNKPLATWKKHRWNEWAVKNNMIKRHELDDITKLVNISAPCTSALKQTCPLMNVLNEYKSQDGEMQYELDFTYLEPFVSHIELYIKSSRSFPSVKQIILQNACISTGPSAVANPTDNDCNSHAYLHFESAYCESVLFTLSVCKDFTVHDGNHNSPTAMTSHRKTVNRPYVNIEKFLWYATTDLQQTPLLSIRTRGVSTDVLKLEPGVNVLRVCGELPAKYSLTVESTADFSVHRTVQTVFEKLVDQPKSVTSVLAHIKHAFTQLHTAEPNTGDHGKKLLQLYSSFMPLSARTENELDKIDRHSIVPKLVQTAVVECILNNLPNDSISIAEVYMDLQEVFQTKAIAGQKLILETIELNEKIENEKLLLDDVMNKKRSVTASKKSTKSKSTSKNSGSVSQKSPPPLTLSASKSVKLAILKIILENTYEVLWAVLNSDKIDLDEYHFKNDLLYHSGYIIHNENITKEIDPLLLLVFRLELNTHAVSDLVPTVIRCTGKSNDVVNLTLIDNRTCVEVRPSDGVNTFLANRAAKGYTLLGWSPDKKPGDKRNQYRLSFFGRPYQVLHSCGMQNDNYNKPYRHNGAVCGTAHAADFVTVNVKHRFLKPNTANLLARVLLYVRNPALCTVYCRLENIESLPMEIRIADKNNRSAVFASCRARGKTALIPIVFLDPNANRTQTNGVAADTESSINVFVIEVRLIKYIDIENTGAPDGPTGDHDWTISCTYDQKVTDITLETDTTVDDYRFISSTARQNSISIKQSIKSTVTTNDNALSEATPDFQQTFDSMTITREVLKRKNSDVLSASLQPREEEIELKILTDKLADRQNVTLEAIRQEEYAANENRQATMDVIFNQDVFNKRTNPNAAKSTMSTRPSRTSKKKS